MNRLREHLTVRLSPGERQTIEAAAMACGVSLSRFVRESASLVANKAIEEYRREKGLDR
jgi:uncharacterized protein (DUF1778 family)